MYLKDKFEYMNSYFTQREKNEKIDDKKKENNSLILERVFRLRIE